MFSQHPDIAKRWSKEYGSKPVPLEKAAERKLKKAPGKSSK